MRTTSIDITLLDDNVTEEDESFDALLEILSPGLHISFFPSDRAAATILEDDSKLN